VRVTDLEGTAWTVRRHWMPRYHGRGLRERWRRRPGRGDDGSWLDLLNFADGDVPGAIAVVALAVIALVLFVLFGLPLLLAAVDLVVVVLATLIGIVGRVVFRRPWTVEAVSAGGERHEVEVVGWRRAGEAVECLGQEIRHGRRPTADPGGSPSQRT
jgi:hypothetical protein